MDEDDQVCQMLIKRGGNLVDQIYLKKEDCCGCSACLTLCPVSAIEFYLDEEGFEYPQINQNICTDCGVCQKVCGFIQHRMEDRSYLSAVGVRLTDKEKLKKSQSGGAFTAFAEIVLNDGGIVYGAGLGINDTYKIRHERIEKIDELDKIKGTKYVQSSLTGIHDSILKDLSQNRIVLFSGTPCQVSSLLVFVEARKLPKETLYTIDVICYGVPSPGVLNDYINFLEKVHGGKVEDFNFRDKNWSGWRSNAESYKINNKMYYSNVYTSLFFRRVIMRPCCHVCPYSCSDRVGDITIGDYWFVENNNPTIDDNRGLSVVLLNDKKGDYLFERAKHLLETWPINEKYTQANLEHPTSASSFRSRFWEEYLEKGPEAIFRQHYFGIKPFINFRLRFYKLHAWGKWLSRRIKGSIRKYY